MNVLPSNNKAWGFYGTAENPENAWPIAFMAIMGATGADKWSVRAFLDSKDGRHFADEIHGSGDIVAAIDSAIKKWSGWKISKKCSKYTGIPCGLNYLTGFVINAGIKEELK